MVGRRADGRARDLVIVTTTLRVGRVRDGAGSRQSGRVVRLLTGSGLDLLLIGLGVLAVVQLRRYDAAGSTTVDPLTTAAPAVVIAGLSVLCLRLLPVLTRQVARVTGEARGLEPAWGGWQLSRRLAGQVGTVLLVLLAVAMGTLALSHSATADRAVEDQSAFETGAPVQVVVGPGAGGVPGTAGPVLARAAGGADRVVPVAREVVDVGPLTGVTALALDAGTGATVVDPRQDLLAGSTWPSLLGRLADGRRLAEGVPLPGEPTRLAVRGHLGTAFTVADEFTLPASVLLRDGRGLVHTLPLGELGVRPADLNIELPSGEQAMEYPLTLLGVFARAPAELVDPSASTPDFSVEVDSVTADGTAVTGLDVLGERSNGSDLLRAGAPADLDAVPAIVTRAVADAARAEVGSTLSLSVAGRQLPLTVAGIVDSVPTARIPDRAVVVDLPTVLALGDGGSPSTRPVEPSEWWLDPVPVPAVRDAVRTRLPAGVTWPCAPTSSPSGIGQPGERRDARRHAAGHRGRAGAGRRRLRRDDRRPRAHPPPRERRAARPRDAARPDPPGARPRAGGGRGAHRRGRPGAGGAQLPCRRRCSSVVGPPAGAPGAGGPAARPARRLRGRRRAGAVAGGGARPAQLGRDIAAELRRGEAS